MEALVALHNRVSHARHATNHPGRSRRGHRDVGGVLSLSVALDPPLVASTQTMARVADQGMGSDGRFRIVLYQVF